MLRTLADLLTASRLAIAAVIVGLGFTRGADGLSAVVYLLLLGWTTDTLDGHVARRAKSTRKTWLSQNDVAVDVVMVVSSFIYLALAGFVPYLACLVYLLVSGTLVAVTRARTLVIVLEAPLALLPPVIGFIESPSLGWAFVGWAALALCLDFRRLLVRVRLLRDGIPEVFGRKSAGRRNDHVNGSAG
jgi:hypothetical protein